MKISITHNDPIDVLPWVPGRKYGIVKVDHVYPTEEEYEGTVAGTRALQDTLAGVVPSPSLTQKGNSVPVFDPVWGYLPKINKDPRALPFWESEGWLWVNIKYKQEHKTPRCELIVSPGNIISWDTQTYAHRKVLAYDCTFDMGVLNPETDNWKYRPDLFWKATSYNRKYEINNVGNGIDAFTMRIKNEGTDVWIHKDEIEEFPERPNYQYRVVGTDVYNGNEPLMRVVGNKRVFYRDDWRMSSPSVIPPAGWNQ